ncbi:MAG: carboxypeptidase [Elusimicrobia bacterium]|nr:MAG: carboxypeptidase [Elusimicrobiota bacterium]
MLATALAAGAGQEDLQGLFDGTGTKIDLKALLAQTKNSVPKIDHVIGFEDRYWVEVTASGKNERTRLADTGMSIDGVNGGVVSGTADSEILGIIQKAGFTVVRATRLSSFSPDDFPPADGTYHNYEEVQSALQTAQGAAPEYATLFSMGKSVEGRDLTGIRFYKDDGKEKPGILFVGTHHAREHLSTEVPLLLSQWLAENRDREDVRELLETRDIYIVPLVNPDGMEFDIATGRYRWHRKNMTRNSNGSVGVDLNRNYAWGWGGRGSSANPGSDTYHGPSAFSEPETQAVRDFIESHPNIKIMLSYHTFSELVLYPWGGSDEPIADGRALGAFKVMAEKMGGMTGYRPMQSSELYVATGDTCDWAWGAKGIFCFTFELTPRSQWQGGFYPGAGAIQGTFAKNIDPALYLIDLADDPYRAGSGRVASAPKPTTTQTGDNPI